jgi:hypothetical protein
MLITKSAVIGMVAFIVLLTSFQGVSLQIEHGAIYSLNPIVQSYMFSPPTIEIQHVNDSLVHKITIDDLPLTTVANHSILPVKPLRILLPNGFTVDEITVAILQSPLILSSIYPQKRSLLYPLYEVGDKKDMSEHSSGQSQELYTTVGIYTIKGYQVLFLNLHPVTYNEQFGQLTYYPRLSVSIQTTPSGSSKTVRGFISDRDQVESLVENPSMMQTYDSVMPTSNPLQSATYLIITSEELAISEFENNFQSLIRSKIDKGITARMVTVEDIIQNMSFSVNGTWGDNNPANPFYQEPITEHFERFDDKLARIRNFIRYAYMTLGTEYVLLGGDADIANEAQNAIPARGLFANESGLPLISSGVTLGEEEDDIPSDIYYACLDGTFNYDMDNHFGESKDRNNLSFLDEADLLSEVSVGRACVDSASEVANFVEKTLRYDRAIDEPFLKKVLFVGEYLGFPGISSYGGNYKDLVIPFVPASYNLETLYDRDLPTSWSKYDIIEIINNATPHLINHDGHSYYGYNMRMQNPDVDRFTNTDPFFLYSHGCMAGGFDNPSGYDCIAERFTVETQAGAFAGILNARYGLGSENNLDSPSLALDISFFKALFTENIRNIGPANHYSKEDHVWHIDENGIRWVYYETNLFGDPELSIHDAPLAPVDISVTISRPDPSGCIYIRNIQLISLPFLKYSYLIGLCVVRVEAVSNPAGYVYSVEFFVDNISYATDTTFPYEWTMDVPLRGTHVLTVVAHARYGETNTTSLPFKAWILDK